MLTRIVVADQAEARFYDLDESDEPLRWVGHLTDPLAHHHDRDFSSDRPGRVFDHAPGSHQRRGAVAHHGTGGERSPRKHEAELFAARIAHELQAAQREGRYDRLVLVVGLPFLGTLRAALPKHVRESVFEEIPKDLLHEPEGALQAHVMKALTGARHAPG